MTYAALAAAVVGGAVVVALVATGVRGLGARWWATTTVTAVVLVALTVVFDSLMIAADLFRYDESALLGVRVWLTPVEDLAWPVVAALLLPALWALVGTGGTGAPEAGRVDA
ncbi:lycopene cyclase domain-containing protein [Isoptericola sp. NPDC057191]|uniref:lycopene cyclase domain-containing protein n=1 Tax=Isoptericola sp. NPDC057191 TaxID=3346041 RepID=UPI0036410A5C